MKLDFEPCGPREKECKNGGTCKDDGNGNKVCDCPPNVSGEYCENKGKYLKP